MPERDPRKKKIEPLLPPKSMQKRKKEPKPTPRKPVGKVPTRAIDKDMEELEELEREMKASKKMTSAEVACHKFLLAYIQTHSIKDAARAILPKAVRDDKALQSKIGQKYWRSRVLQRMLDEHLEEFGKKTRRLRRMTVMKVEELMNKESGIGGHMAQVKAADVMTRILGMQETTKNVKSKGGQVLGDGLLILPGIANLEDWARSAPAAQADLKQRTKDAHISTEAKQEDIDGNDD